MMVTWKDYFWRAVLAVIALLLVLYAMGIIGCHVHLHTGERHYWGGQEISGSPAEVVRRIFEGATDVGSVEEH